ncbi:hypothetical protein BGW37DRAFT_491442 [Umbelopsis sp. PMI_123]|nr:hypothetical protein BGW37DRAFT_491442 [Umbelopsis sp. PMI_123]
MFGQQQRTLSAIALVYLSYFASSVYSVEEGSNTEDKRELNPHWGIIHRNVIGSPSITLQNGPFVHGATELSPPPFGNGGLAFLVGSGIEKAEFGNEVDYYGKLLRDINQVGFHVFTTGEDTQKDPDNLPNIRFELYFHIGATLTYTSLVWTPPANAVTVNEWSRFINATNEGTWWFSQDDAIGTGCMLSAQCTFSDMLQKAYVVDPSAYIMSFAVGKGRDYEWQGAIDGLRINDKTINFEFDGVYEISHDEHSGEDKHHQ